MNRATFQAFQAHAASSPFEVCGLVLDGPERYFPCRNVAEGADEFAVHPEDWAKAEDRGAILAVCHSHPGMPSRPSPADVANQEKAGLPYCILGADGLWTRDRSPVEGRVYRFGWHDCAALVRDFYGDLPDVPRDEGDGYAPWLPSFFREVLLEDLQGRDLLLMGRDHAGVYLGGGKMLHHKRDQLSRIAPVWPRCISSVWRRA